MIATPLPDAVAAAFAEMPAPARRRALELRELVFETAARLGLGPLEESLKWGEPAYRPGRSGTTIRLAADRAAGTAMLLVHCQTSLVETWRGRFAGRLDFEGNRAVLVPGTAPIDREAIRACIEDALCYHATRRRAAHG